MSYPNRLLPQPNYIKISNCTELLNCFLIRHTSSKEVIDIVTNKLKQELVVLQTDHLRDYSNNLLGIFELDDIYWSIQANENKERLIASWENGVEVTVPAVPFDFSVDYSRGYFFLEISKCHEKVVPFEDATSTVVKCILIHTPINSNFWHFSLRWLCDGVDSTKLENKTKRRRFLAAARIFIIEKATFEVPPVYILSRANYIA